MKVQAIPGFAFKFRTNRLGHTLARLIVGEDDNL